ncbi:MAG: LysM peptidoglycan-binding domain-containing protein [Pseudomonadota bacterium]
MRTLLLIAALGLSAPTWADEVRLQENAPDRHVVVRGDTLWDISAKFLKDPWVWPEVWQLNKEQIKNPHLIYPGDVVLLTMENGKPRLSLESPPIDVVRLSPQVRGEPLAAKESGIPSIPVKAIQAMLTKSGVGDVKDLQNAPRILGSSDARVMFGNGDAVYASKGDGTTKEWRVVRLGQALKNPDNPEEVLTYEMLYLGTARTDKQGDPMTVRILRADQEILERDRLLPNQNDELIQYAPHAPDKPMEAKVVAALGGPVMAGTYMTLVLNKGRGNGMEPGHVLALFRAGRSVADPKCNRAKKIDFMSGGRSSASECTPGAEDNATLPDTRVGLAFVYRVFDKVSYALVMSGTEPVSAGDLARNP